MIILANIVFSAFRIPYVSAMFFPVATITALAAEAIVFRLFNRNLSWRRIVSTVLVINIASAIVGFAIAGALPSGLEPTIRGEGENQFETLRRGPKFGMYVVLGYILAFILSIVIEWGIVRALRPIAKLTRPFVTVGLANVASYVALIVLSIGWSWLFQ
ncbi:MAG: hypothetical protein GY774_06170 [Planctomycetes bacterium]|nr:hypothetical protein [Planctomycetota bacterium]